MARLSPCLLFIACLLAACGPGKREESGLLPAPSSQVPVTASPSPPASIKPSAGSSASPRATAPATAPARTPTPRPKPPTPVAQALLATLPAQVDLKLAHDYQKWNNCGPVSLAVITTYFGIPRDQYQAAAEVKGAEFDKNVGTAEMQAYLENAGLRAITRVNGSQAELLRLLAAKIPVIVLQWLLKPDNELVGHYRVVQGYDQRAGMFITSDPYTPPHKLYSFTDFERFWQPWNHRYIVAFHPEEEGDVRQALGDDFDEKGNLSNALQATTEAIAAHAGDPYAYFSLGDDRLAGGDAVGALAAYDKAYALGISPHFAWYNFGPYAALYGTGSYQRILDMSAPVLKDANNVEELHYWRGKAWLGLGQTEKAKAEFALAVQFNAHYTEARDALAAVP